MVNRLTEPDKFKAVVFGLKLYLGFSGQRSDTQSWEEFQ